MNLTERNSIAKDARHCCNNAAIAIDNLRRSGVRRDHHRDPVLDGAQDGREIMLPRRGGVAEPDIVGELDKNRWRVARPLYFLARFCALRAICGRDGELDPITPPGLPGV